MTQSNVVRIRNLTPIPQDLDAAMELFLSYCRAKNLSANTLIYYSCRLRAFAKYVQETNPDTSPEEVTPQLVRAFLSDETERHSASTAVHSYVALRALFNFLVRDGCLPGNPMANVEKPRKRRSVVSTFTLDQIEDVLATCKRDFVEMRDRAMILTMLDCGLRASELCGLRLEDISWAEQTLLVVGKGDTERVVPFGMNTRQALNDYLSRRGELTCKALFVSVYGESINRHGVGRIMQRRCISAAVSGPQCSPHTLRHTFAVHFLRNGGDAFSLQKILGHSDLAMTRRYVELSETDVREKHRMFSPADRLQAAKKTTGRKRLR